MDLQEPKRRELVMGFYRFDDEDEATKRRIQQTNERLSKQESRRFTDVIRNKLYGPAETDDDEDDGYYLDDPEEALTRLLKRIGSIRDQLDQTQGQLSDLLQEEPELAQQYRRFIQQGGLTAEDFERFQLNLLRPRITRSRKHLRLVSSTKPVKKRPRITPRGGSDDDAA
jgi:hypothetical protein